MANRITLASSIIDSMVELSEGNPGAATVLLSLIENYEKIDPQAVLRYWAVLMWLDDQCLYGSSIWMLYKDVCGENLARMIAMVRAVQLGYLSSATLHEAIDGRYDRAREPLDVAKYYMMVKEHSEKFDTENKACIR